MHPRKALQVTLQCNQNTNFKKIQTRDVVTIARIVPTGMDFWASLRSPDLFEPAIIPWKKNDMYENYF